MVEDVKAKVLAIREAKKASLKGVELMQYNLYWKLRGWIMRETGHRVVCVGELVEKIGKYAPKAILKSREQFERAVKDLWSSAHEDSIDSEEWLREDLEFELSYIYESE